jgi:hypothetical protein
MNREWKKYCCNTSKKKVIEVVMHPAKNSQECDVRVWQMASDSEWRENLVC